MANHEVCTRWKEKTYEHTEIKDFKINPWSFKNKCRKMSGFVIPASVSSLVGYYLTAQTGRWLARLVLQQERFSPLFCVNIFCNQFYGGRFLTSECFQNWFASYNQDVHVYTTKIIGRVSQRLQFLLLAGQGQYEN